MPPSIVYTVLMIPRIMIDQTTNWKWMLPKRITDTASAAMNRRDPDVKSWPTRNMTLLARFDVSPNLSPMNP